MNLFLFSLLFVLLGAVSRLVPHPPNFTLMTALALTAGARMKPTQAFLCMLAILVVSDAIIGFYNPLLMAFTYGSFALITWFGIGMKHDEKSRYGKVVFFSVGSATLFFIVTNFGVWALPHSLYPKTFSGLVACYVAAIPFFWNTLASAVFCSVAFFTAKNVVFFKQARLIHE